MTDQKKIGSLSTFVTEVAKITPREGYTLFFRGQPEENYTPVPSIFRHIDKGDSNSTLFSMHEHVMYEQIISACLNDFLSCQSTFDHLVKMQHYGLPTRLLDITTNPLVALYFASNKDKLDGEVIIYEIKNEDVKFHGSDTVSILSNLAKMNEEFICPKSSKDARTDKEKRSSGILLHCIYAEKPYFKDIINHKHFSAVLAIRPKLDNPRIIRQNGAFLIFGSEGNKTIPTSKTNHLYKEFSCEEVGGFLHKTENKGWVFKINGRKKEKIIDELAINGISKAVLFPEIDSVSDYIKNTTVSYLSK